MTPNPALAASADARLAFAETLQRAADRVPAHLPNAAAGWRHLADLYTHCGQFYPEVPVPAGEGLPWRGRHAVPGGLIGSPGAACSALGARSRLG